MKLNKIILQAFGPFAGKEVIDFSKLESSSIFLISGPTGSGKTTIFDAICFAIYGKVSGRRKEPKTLKSSFASPETLSFVMLEFTCNGSRYKITRYPQQEKLGSRGNIVTFDAKAELILPGGKQITKIRLADDEIKKIIGIGEDDFEKLVMLPQGKFQKLLLEKGKDRVQTLRHIFKTELYAKITELFYKKSNELDKAQKEWEKQCRLIFEDVSDLDFNEVSIPEGVEMLHKYNEECRDKETTLNEQKRSLEISKNKAQERISQAEKIEENFRILREKEAEFENLQKQKIQMDKLSEEIKKLQSFEELFSAYSQVKQSEKQLEESENSLKKAKADYIKCEAEFKLCEKEREKSAELSRQIQDLQKSILLIENEEGRAGKKEALQKRLSSLEKDISTLQKQKKADEIQQEIASIKEKIEQKMQWELLSKSILETERELKKAQENYLELSSAYLKSQASSLARQLEDGEPCPVCGSIHHPKAAEDLTSHIEQSEVENCLQIRGRLSQKLQDLKFNREKQDEPANADMLTLQKSLKDAEEKLSKTHPKVYDSEDILQRWERASLEKEKLLAALEEYPEEFFSLEEYRAKKIHLQENLRQNSAELERIQQAYLSLQREIGALCERKDSLQAQTGRAKRELETKTANLLNLLNEKGSSEAELIEMQTKRAFLEEKRNALEEYRGKTKEISAVIKLLKNQLDGVGQPDISLLKKQLDEITEKYRLCELEQSKLKEKLTVQLLCEKNLNRIYKQMEIATRQYGILQKLSQVARGSQNGMSFEKYVLSSYFDEVIAYANLRAERLNGFHYQLIRMQEEYQDGISLGVLDTYNGDVRPINTLSGGETFVASLSLSLGLADVISKNAGGAVLETMLIDEGFGGLDDQYLKSVTDCLTQLQENYRQIGIISHVKQLKEQISNQISIEKCGPFEGSRIRVRGEGDFESEKSLYSSGFLS